MEGGGRSIGRSSELEMGLSSSDKPVEVEIDIVASKPSSSNQNPHLLLSLGPSMLLKNCVVWTKRRSLDLGIGFNFQMKLRFVFLVRTKKLVPLLIVRLVFIKLLFCAALGSPFTLHDGALSPS